MPAEWTHINYGVNRVVREPHKRRRLECKNGKLRMKVDWESDEDHDRIRNKIMGNNPGWRISGYCIAKRTAPAKDHEI